MEVPPVVGGPGEQVPDCNGRVADPASARVPNTTVLPQSIVLGIYSFGLDNCGASYLHNNPFQPYPTYQSVDTVALEFISYASAIGNPTPLHG